MNDNVIEFSGLSYADIPIEKVLSEAHEVHEGMDHIIIISGKESGDILASSSTSDLRYILWLVEQLKYQILSGEYASEE